MTTDDTNNINENHPRIDYREAFVAEVEMAAHSWTCRQCASNALRGRKMDECFRFRYLQETRELAYAALPPYYKDRYDKAANTLREETTKSLQGHGIHVNA